jgi:hypothetical protein
MKLAQQTLENIALTPNLPPTTTTTSNSKAITGESSRQRLELTPQLVNADANENSVDRPENSEDKMITKTKRESDPDSSWLNQVIQNE